jgi:hypothetical protein
MNDEVENMLGEVEKIWKWWCSDGCAIKIFWSDWEKSEKSWHRWWSRQTVVLASSIDMTVVR